MNTREKLNIAVFVVAAVLLWASGKVGETAGIIMCYVAVIGVSIMLAAAIVDFIEFKKKQ